MKQNRDWTEVMRSTLRDAEATPPAGGWARLERELGATAPRGVVWRLPVMRVAAAAAAVLLCVAAGSYLWRMSPELGSEGNVIATTADGGAATQSLTTATPEPLLAAVSAPPARIAPQQRTRTVQNRRTIAEPRSMEANSEPVAVNDPALAPALQDTAPQTPTPASDTKSTPQPQPARATQPQTRVQSARSGASRVGGEKFVAYRAPHKRSSLALFAGGGVTGGRSVGNPGSSVQRLFADIQVQGGLNAVQSMFAQDYEQSTFHHHQPFSFGLSVRKELGHGLSLESGVNYTLLLSSVTLPYASEDYSQKLHFIGVPLRLNWNFLERRNFNLYIGAGGMVEKCVAAKFGSTSVEEPRIQWSVAGVVGAEYRLGGRAGLYFEPEASYYFTQTELRTARTDAPLTLTLRLGLRFSF